METSTTTTATAQALAEMFTENTGKHFLDSGSAYGRNWERNAGLTAEMMLNLPSATWERNWSPTISAFHFLNDRLTYSKLALVLTRLMRVWEHGDYDNRNLYSCGDQQEFLESLGAENIRDFNTYNWDNLLSQTIQGMEFELHGVSLLLLQVHGGCDVRGGYTLPRIFEVTSDADFFWGGLNDVNLDCPACEITTCLRVYEPEEWYRYGTVEPDLFGNVERYFYAPEGYDQANGCPECGGDLVALAREVY